MDGIVLQQSWLCWELCSGLCDEHGIVSQHCIACSGVVMAPQSAAYKAIAAAMIKSRNGFARRILNQAMRVDRVSQYRLSEPPESLTR
jgi:hypothetical protein